METNRFLRLTARAFNVFVCNAIACSFLIYMFDFGMSAPLLGVIAASSAVSVAVCSVKKHGAVWLVGYFLAVVSIGLLLHGQLAAGMKGFIDQFAKTVASTHSIEYDLETAGAGMEGQFAVIAVAEMLACMLLAIAYTAKKNYYGWIAVTGCILIVAMILNVFPPAPIVIAFFFMLVYLKITASLENAESGKVMMYCVFTVILLFVAALSASTIWSEERHADSLRNGEIRKRVRDFNDNIGGRVGRFMSSRQLPFEDNYSGMSGGSISSGSIKSLNRTDLIVYMPDNSPATYLKGYTGVTYRNGKWIEEDENVRYRCFRNTEYWSRAGIDMDQTLSFAMMEAAFREIPSGESYFPVYLANLGIVVTGANSAYDYVPYAGAQIVNTTGVAVYYNPSGLPNIMAVDGTLQEYSKLTNQEDGQFYHQASQEFMWEYGMEEFLTVPGDFRDVLQPVIDEYYNDYLPKHPASDYNDILQGKIDFVKRYLRENYVYTTNPPKNTTSKDPVMFFIQDSHAGYCQHFASTAIMLLRMLDVPCRYGEGYIVHLSDIAKGKKKSEVLPNDDEKLGEMLETWGKAGDIEKPEIIAVNVPNGNAHAWAEIWINDYGWHPIEATVGYESTVRNWEIPTPKPTQNPNGTTPTPNTNPTKTPTKKPTQDQTKPEQTGEKNNILRNGILTALAVLAVMALPVGYVTWLKERRRRRFLSKNVKFAVKAIYEDIVRIADYMGIHRGENEANREFHARLIKDLPQVCEEVSFEQVSEIAERAAYSAERLTKEDRKAMLLYYRKIRAHFLSEVNPFRRAYLKMIKGI